MAARGPRSSRSRAEAVEREDSRRGNAPPARSASGEASGETKPTRGRPKENRGTVVLTLRLPPDVVEAADAIVAASGHVYRDRSEFFRQTIATAVQRLGEAAELKKARYEAGARAEAYISQKLEKAEKWDPTTTQREQAAKRSKAS